MSREIRKWARLERVRLTVEVRIMGQARNLVKSEVRIEGKTRR
jgi:hypothetical protein